MHIYKEYSIKNVLWEKRCVHEINEYEVSQNTISAQGMADLLGY